jgi:fatty aldehyde-generating acyl-ACP reductase
VDSFAFIIHPIDPKRDVSRKFPLLGTLFNEPQINYLCRFFPPVYLSEIEGITSAATGAQIKGWLIACPLTAARMLELSENIAYRKVIQTGRLAERLGVDILGLGAFTSVIGDGGVTIANNLSVPVTTGNAYTISIAIQAIIQAGELLGIPVAEATAAIVGATGTIGQACARLLADKVTRLYLIARDQEKLAGLQASLQKDAKARIMVSKDLHTLREAQLVLTVSSSIHAIVQPEHLRPGSVICDVARPRDVSERVAAARDDVLVLDGGMVDVPGQVNFNFDFGFPPGKAYACMAETMALALEGRFENYSLGKTITQERVEEITAIADKHGFRLSGFRSFERAVPAAHIERVRKHAQNHS